MIIDTYSDKKIDALGRTAFANAMKHLRALLEEEHVDPDYLEAVAAVAQAAATGLDDEENHAPVIGDYDQVEPNAELNDDSLNEIARDVWYVATSRANDLVTAKKNMPERLRALAQVADAAACGFKNDGDDDE